MILFCVCVCVCVSVYTFGSWEISNLIRYLFKCSLKFDQNLRNVDKNKIFNAKTVGGGVYGITPRDNKWILWEKSLKRRLYYTGEKNWDFFFSNCVYNIGPFFRFWPINLVCFLNFSFFLHIFIPVSKSAYFLMSEIGVSPVFL